MASPELQAYIAEQLKFQADTFAATLAAQTKIQEDLFAARIKQQEEQTQRLIEAMRGEFTPARDGQGAAASAGQGQRPGAPGAGAFSHPYGQAPNPSSEPRRPYVPQLASLKVAIPQRYSGKREDFDDWAFHVENWVTMAFPHAATYLNEATKAAGAIVSSNGGADSPFGIIVYEAHHGEPDWDFVRDAEVVRAFDLQFYAVLGSMLHEGGGFRW